jgi:hypothetical protein
VVRLTSFVLTPMAAASLVALLVASAVVCRWLVRSGRVPRPFWLLFAASASVAVIVSVTLFREPWHPSWPLGPWSADGWELLVTDPLRSSQVMANVALFVPAGATWTVLTRRPWSVLGTLTLLSATIEVLQGLTRSGANDPGDLVANTAGAALGIALAWSVVRVREDLRQRRPLRRTLGGLAAGAAIGGVVLSGVAQVGAGLQLRALTSELEATYGGTDLADLHRWQAEDRFSEMVIDAASVRSDGIEHADDPTGRHERRAFVRARYPATFLSARRCAFVRWTDDGVQVTGSRGQECSRFLG